TSGIHSDYHRPGDKSHLLDYTQMESRMAYIHDFLLLVAGLEALPVLPTAQAHFYPNTPNKIYSLTEVDVCP
ncbi:MAG: hypothetical protein FWE99_07420, partial [Bacteroidales bacterium]|nr:hypothetical protein [Bacteroidales bacterium]